MVSALAGSALKKVGVEMVVEGVQSFVKDLAKGNAEISLFGKRAKEASSDMSFFEKAMNFVGDTLRRVFEIASGILVADVFRKIASGIASMVQGAFDAGVAFQQLEVRLEGLLARDIRAEMGVPFADALNMASDQAEELFDWITKVALASPLGTQAVADVFTLAKGYGFATDMAKDLTEAVIDFTSGMGLGNTEMQRIIENFGQMQFQGKVTSTELRDLARGAFVPVLDIMERIRKEMEGGAGLVDFGEDITKTTAKLEEYKDKLAIAEQRQSEFTSATKESVRMSTANQIENYKQKIEELAVELAGMNAITEGTGEITEEMFKKIKDEGIPAELFFQEFIRMVNEDFPDAGRRASRTFEGVRGNLKDLTQDLIGLKVVRPALDAIAAPIADLIDSITTGDRGERFRAALEGIGKSFASFIEYLAGFLPNADTVAEKIVSFLEKLENKFGNFRDVITEIFDPADGRSLLTNLELLFDWITGDTNFGNQFGNIIDGFREGLANLSQFWQVHGEAISASIKQIVAAVLPLVSEIVVGGLNLLAEGFAKLTQWIVDNGPQIEATLSNFADIMKNQIVPGIEAALSWIWEHRDDVYQFIAFWTPIIATFLTTKAVLELLSPVIKTVTVLFTLMLTPVAPLIIALGGLAAAIIGIVVLLPKISSFVSSAVSYFKSLASYASSYASSVARAFLNINWSSVGRSIVYGIISGLSSAVSSLISYAIQIALAAYNAMRSVLGIRSPSTLFAGVGQNIASGLIQGMLEGIPAVAGAAQALASATLGSMNAAPAYVQNSNVTYNSTRNMTMNVNTSAPSEPIISDFRMMEGMLS